MGSFKTSLTSGISEEYHKSLVYYWPQVLLTIIVLGSFITQPIPEIHLAPPGATMLEIESKTKLM